MNKAVKVMDLVWLIAILGVWFVLQVWILRRLGVSTSNSCSVEQRLPVGHDVGKGDPTRPGEDSPPASSAGRP